MLWYPYPLRALSRSTSSSIPEGGWFFHDYISTTPLTRLLFVGEKRPPCSHTKMATAASHAEYWAEIPPNTVQLGLPRLITSSLRASPPLHRLAIHEQKIIRFTNLYRKLAYRHATSCVKIHLHASLNHPIAGGQLSGNVDTGKFFGCWHEVECCLNFKFRPDETAALTASR